MKSNMYKVLGIVALLSISFWCGYQWQNKKNSPIVTEVNNDLFLPIYGADSYSMERKLLYYYKFNKNLSCKKLLQELGNKISERLLRGLPVIVDSISTLNAKKVAYINLKESQDNKWTWKGHLFQGSSGGMNTSTILRETFLQKDYDGEWIDGVLISYEGVSISKDFWDQMGGLDGIRWRDSTLEK